MYATVVYRVSSALFRFHIHSWPSLLENARLVNAGNMQPEHVLKVHSLAAFDVQSTETAARVTYNAGPRIRGPGCRSNAPGGV